MTKLLRSASQVAAAVLFASFAAAAPLPSGEDALRRSTTTRLSGLFALSPEEALRPVTIDRVAGRPPVLPAWWSDLPPWAAGGARPEADRLVVIEARTGAWPFGDGSQTLAHELSHVLLHRAVGRLAPRWFDEGVALRVSGEWEAPLAAGGLLAGWPERPSLGKIESDFLGGEAEARRSYELAKGFTAHLFPTAADLTGFVREVRERESFDQAFLLRFGRSPEQEFRVWTGGWPLALRIVATIGSGGIAAGAGALLIPVAAILVRRRRRRRLDQLEPPDEPPALVFPQGELPGEKPDVH